MLHPAPSTARSTTPRMCLGVAAGPNRLRAPRDACATGVLAGTWMLDCCPMDGKWMHDGCPMDRFANRMVSSWLLHGVFSRLTRVSQAP